MISIRVTVVPSTGPLPGAATTCSVRCRLSSTRSKASTGIGGTPRSCGTPVEHPVDTPVSTHPVESREVNCCEQSERQSDCACDSRTDESFLCSLSEAQYTELQCNYGYYKSSKLCCYPGQSVQVICERASCRTCCGRPTRFSERKTVNNRAVWRRVDWIHESI